MYETIRSYSNLVFQKCHSAVYAAHGFWIRSRDIIVIEFFLFTLIIHQQIQVFKVEEL